MNPPKRAKLTNPKLPMNLTPTLLALCLFLTAPLLWAENSQAPAKAVQQWPTPNKTPWRDTSGEWVTLKAPLLELHTAPGRGYPIFHVVEKNQPLRIFKSHTEWYQVETEDGKTGWAHRKNLGALQDTEGRYLNITPPTWKQAHTKPWNISLMAGTLDGSTAYTPVIGYQFSSNFTLEGHYTQAFGAVSSLNMASLQLNHQPLPHWRLSPYFALSAGRLSTHPNAILVKTQTREDSLVGAGAGLIFYTNAHIALRMEYQKSTLLTHRDTHQEIEQWKAGFSLLF